MDRFYVDLFTGEFEWNIEQIKVDKIQSTVQKAVMKMQQDLSPGQRHVIDIPEHFMPEHSRDERKILVNGVQMPPQ